MPRKRKEQNENFYKALPNAMRNLMEEQKRTQNELADYLGKTRQAISYYCDGSSSPDWETLAKIADFFHVSTDYLVGRTNDPNMFPAAADDLGLSAKAIDYIRGYSNPKHSDQENLKSFFELVKPNECLEGLSMLIESGRLLSLAGDIKMFRDTIRRNIEISEKYRKEYPSETSPDLYKIIRAHADNSVEETFQKELESLFPESKGTFSLLVGSSFVEYKRTAIIDEFDKMVQLVSNYKEFEEKVKLR